MVGGGAGLMASARAVPTHEPTGDGLTGLAMAAPFSNPFEDEAALAGSPDPLLGDADNDGDKDFDDVRAIFAARNIAAEPEDVRDWDADGRISVLDARQLILDIRLTADQAGPVIAAALSNDTAPGEGINLDTITADSAIAGTVIDANRVTRLWAGLDETAPEDFLPILGVLQADGSFALSPEQLETINGGPLAEGRHTLRLQAKDEFGNESAPFAVAFTLDTTAPELNLTTEFDQPLTSLDRLQGSFTDASRIAALSYRFGEGDAIDVAVDRNGAFNAAFDLEGLDDGENTLTITAIDSAGNVTTNSFAIEVANDPRPEGTIFWQGGSGNWNDIENWIDAEGENRLPTADDIVFVDVVGDQTVTVNSGSFTVDTLFSEETLALSGGNLTITDAAELNEGINLSGGMLTADGAIVIADQSEWTVGTITGAAGVTNTGNLNISGGGSKVLRSTLTNQGDIIHTGGSLFLNGTLNNAADALYDIQAGSITRSTVSSVFNNSGILRKSTDSTVSASVDVNNVGGTVEVEQGQLNLIRGGNSTDSTYTVAADAQFNFGGGTHVFNGTSTFSGEGTVRVSSGNVETTEASETTWDMNQLELAGGILTANGTNILAGQSEWTGGTITGAAGVTNTGDLNISGGGSKVLTDSTLTNQGTITHTGGALFLNDGTLNNAADGLYDIQAGSLFRGSRSSVQNFNNSGTLQKSTDSNVTVAVDFNSNGLVDAQAGTLSFTRSVRRDSAEKFQENGGTIQISGTLTEDNTLPDLQITSPNPLPTLTPGETAMLSWLVTNQGTDTTSATPWTDAIFLSDDDQLDSSDRLITTRTVNTSKSALAVGDSYTAERTITVPDTLINGQFILFATDWLASELEDDETNNLIAALV